MKTLNEIIVTTQRYSKFIKITKKLGGGALDNPLYFVAKPYQ